VSREVSQRAITWSLNSVRLRPPFNTPILNPPPLLLPPVISLPAWKKLSKTRHNLYVKNFYTHTMVANRWMNNWCKFCLHSLRSWETITQWLLKISISPNKALCVEARLCQFQSHIVNWMYFIIVKHVGTFELTSQGTQVRTFCTIIQHIILVLVFMICNYWHELHFEQLKQLTVVTDIAQH